MIQYEKRTLNVFLAQIGETYREQKAVTFEQGDGFTYEQLLKAVDAFDRVLTAAGVGKGDKVGLLANNSPWWAAAYFAAAAYGRVIVPILPDFTAADVENILRHSESKALFLSSTLLHKNREIFSHLPGLKFFALDGAAVLTADGDWPSLSFDEFNARTQSVDFSSVVERLKTQPTAEEDMAAIIYTSGTTGSSKGVMLTHRNLVSNVISARVIPPQPETIDVSQNAALSILPLSHTYECTIGLLTTLNRGCHIHYISKPLAPTTLIPVMQRIRPGIMLSVPLLIEKIYRKSILTTINKKAFTRALYKWAPTRKLLNRIAGKKMYRLFGGNLVFFGIGGAPLAPDVELFLREGKFPYCLGYGLTETSPLVVGSNASDQRYRATGHLIDDVEVRIADADPKTGEGEIQVKGPNVMKGYFKDPERTAEVFTEDGWFRTGDLGVLKKDYLYIRGRLKNVILGASGENIYPESIEAMINEFEFVEDSLIIEDEKKTLTALVHLNMDELKKKFGDSAQAAGDYIKHIIEEVNKRLSNFSKISRSEHQKEPFEKTATQKIKRFLYNRDSKNKGEKK